jgi:proteasome lid subunit RPN8/RPN11
MMDAIFAQAEAAYPREACGLIVRAGGIETFHPCRNVALRQTHFVLDPADYASAAAAGEIVAVVHSHPDATPEPSPADRAACNAAGLPWLIVSWPAKEFAWIYPEESVAPLKGRPYVYGVFDCWTLVRDYYRTELGVRLQIPAYAERWYCAGQNLILDQYERLGFVRIAEEELRKHDLIAMQVDRSEVPNHLAIYLDGNRMLHQQLNRLSGEEIYGGYWQRNAVLFLRHHSLC